MINGLFSLIVILFTMVGIGYSQWSILPAKISNLTKSEAKKQEENDKIKIDFLNKLPNLGFNNLIADWIYLQFVQYYGDRAREITGYGLAPDYFQAFVNKDPRFIKPYFLFSPATTLFAGRPDETIAIMNQGLKSISPELPEAYQVWFYKGIDELLFVANSTRAMHSYEMAEKWAKYHDTFESKNAAEQARQTIAFLKNNPDSKQARAAAWMSIFANAHDERVRRIALVNIQRLGGKIVVDSNRISLSFFESD